MQSRRLTFLRRYKRYGMMRVAIGIRRTTLHRMFTQTTAPGFTRTCIEKKAISAMQPTGIDAQVVQSPKALSMKNGIK